LKEILFLIILVSKLNSYFFVQNEDRYWYFKDEKIDFPLFLALKAVKEQSFSHFFKRKKELGSGKFFII